MVTGKMALRWNVDAGNLQRTKEKGRNIKMNEWKKQNKGKHSLKEEEKKVRQRKKGKKNKLGKMKKTR